VTAARSLPFVHDPARTDGRLLERLSLFPDGLLDRLRARLEEGAGGGALPRDLIAAPGGRGKSHLCARLALRPADLPCPARRPRLSPRAEHDFDRFESEVLAGLEPPVLLVLDDLDLLLARWGARGRKAFRAVLQGLPALGVLATTRPRVGGPGLPSFFADRGEAFFGFFRVEVLEDPSPEAFVDWFLEAFRVSAPGPATARTRALEAWLAVGSGRDLLRETYAARGADLRFHLLLARHLPLVCGGARHGDLRAAFLEALAQAEDLCGPLRTLERADLSPQQGLILRILETSPEALTVTRIAELAGVTHQTASSQLRILRQQGFATAARKGRHSYYSTNRASRGVPASRG